MENKKIEIFAGPCSINKKNLDDIYRIAEIKVNSKKIITGVRVVGLKSRTSFNPSGSGMGIDFEAILENMKILEEGGTYNDLKVPESVSMAQEIAERTSLQIASEVMLPSVQLPVYERTLKSKKMLLWNPSVNQLGWQVLKMSNFCRRNNWRIGIKNGKWVGEDKETADETGYKKITSVEKAWQGLCSYAKNSPSIIIHRGFDIAHKGNFRNFPLHNLAARVKKAAKKKLFLDPSHIYGPKLKDKIVSGTIEAMKLKLDNNKYLYDGILIEAGTSETDTEQHITIEELKIMCDRLADFRILTTQEL